MRLAMREPSERGERIYTLYVSQSSPRRAYIYAHTGIHSLPGADTANKLSRKPLLIPTDVGEIWLKMGLNNLST